MTIAEVTAHPLAIPPTGGDVPWIWGAFNQVYVEIKTEDGLVGWGEAFGYGQPLAATALVNHTLRPLLVGRDERDIRGIVDRM